jgi:hypothetical protein
MQTFAELKNIVNKEATKLGMTDKHRDNVIQMMIACYSFDSEQRVIEVFCRAAKDGVYR